MAGKDASDAKKMRQVFRDYREARLSKLDDKTKAEVEAVLAVGPIPFPFSDDGTAAFMPTPPSLRKKGFPVGAILRRSFPDVEGIPLFEAYLLVHELEHAIQRALAKSMGVEKLYDSLNRAGDPNFVRSGFLQEASAMAAEADFLLAIPGAAQKFENLLAKQIEKSGLSRDEFLSGVFSGTVKDEVFDKLTLSGFLKVQLALESSSDIRSYLRTMWQRTHPSDPTTGTRYSLSDWREIRDSRLPKPPADTAAIKKGRLAALAFDALVASAGIAGMLAGCKVLRESHPDLYRRYCPKFLKGTVPAPHATKPEVAPSAEAGAP